ncbi:MFS transporter [Sphingomonas sp. CROZ-RG-20F-R02-07]|uniref:MFS transporter n=1 Tax=Sphingomonas sp. CROZ-RG-20F-R02-07 TaxID=2914832 RepID=UPI001F59B273|nr:MFS transporter [Sphingomonas sp. CROZ-RG-20F-R02-07]
MAEQEGASAVTGVPLARRNAVLAAATMGGVLVTLDISVVNVALKALQQSFDVQLSALQWVMNIYTLPYAALLLSAGTLADRVGVRRLFIIGFGLFTLSSLACGAAPSFAILLAARASQGVGAALLMPCALALLQRSFPAGGDRAKAIGLFSGASSLAIAAGPLLGGMLIEHVGWRGIFLINLPLGIYGTWLTRRFAPSDQITGNRRFHVLSQALIVASLSCLVGALTEVGRLGWQNLWILGGLLSGILLLIAFLAIDSRDVEPLVPITLLRDRMFASAAVVGALLAFAFYGLIFVFSIFFQSAQHLSPLATGVAFLPMTALIGVANIASGRMTARFGARTIMLSGLAVAVAGCVSLLAVGRGSALMTTAPLFAMAGCGIAFAVPAMMATAFSGHIAARAGTAAGVLNAVRQTGAALRGGSGNLHIGDKWIADLTAAMLAASRRQDEQATTPKPQPGVQGKGGTGRREGREDAGRAGAAI